MANTWGNNGNSERLYFGGSKITADGECSHEIKRHLLPGRKAMANLDSILKSRDITLQTEVCLVKAMFFLVVMYECESWTIKKAECWRTRLLNCGVGEISWKSLGLQGDPNNPSKRKSVLNVHWKDWQWSWNSNTLATWCEELTHIRLCFWERLKAEGEGDDRGWQRWLDGIFWLDDLRMTWVWASSGSWWWTGEHSVLKSIGLQSAGHDWVTELNWTDTYIHLSSYRYTYTEVRWHNVCYCFKISK